MYPISFAADYEGEGRNRLTTLFRYLIVIPWAIVGALFIIGAEICALIAWFAIVFTGRYPEGLYNFNAKAVRMLARVNGLQLMLTDEYPPFNGDPDDAYPIRVGVAPPLPEYSRVKTFFRMIVGIPVFLLSYVQGIIGGVCALIAWFAILFTGRLPDGLFNPIRSALAYQTRALAYILLMTEDYPPFSYDEAQEQGAIAATQAPPLAPPAQQAPQPGQAPPPPPPPQQPPPQQ
ncbi:MAG TPA: DUF4389 domain-containing protein [Solirubrobacterales bacterium]|nr:DUF4389 domain-containing protein [Solirubrobacterales bacterium]